MSGWIKLEKDLRTDPRLINVGSQLCNGQALQGIALALGCLAQLWMIADTHIGNDDVLPLGIDDINQIIGVQNFCQFLPPDWLQVIDAHNVKLPDFHTHNGTIAKARAVSNLRVTKHRANGNGTSVTKPLPDLDLDLDLDKKKKAPSVPKKSATRLAANWQPTDADSAYAKKHLLNVAYTADAFRDYWTAAAGPNARKLDWGAAFRTWCRREAGQAPRGRAPLNGAPDHSTEWAEAKSRAAAIGFREPWPQESPGAYVTQIKFAETNTPRSVLNRLHIMSKPQ